MEERDWSASGMQKVEYLDMSYDGSWFTGIPHSIVRHESKPLLKRLPDYLVGFH